MQSDPQSHRRVRSILFAAAVAAMATCAAQAQIVNGTIEDNEYNLNLATQTNPTGYGDNGRTRSAGGGTSAVSVKETAGGLTPGTTYHYRLVATNQGGTSVGRDRTFMLLPATPAVHLPSDLVGIITARYDADRFDRQPRAAVGSACTQIRRAVRAIQPRMVTEPRSRARLDRAMSQMSKDLERLLADRRKP